MKMKTFTELVGIILNESKSYDIDKGDYDPTDFKEGDTLIYAKKKYVINDLMGDNEYFGIEDVKTKTRYSISMMMVDDGPKKAMTELN
jgi:hypothetical protein